MKIGIAVLGFLILVCAGILSAGILSSSPAPDDELGNGTLITPTTIDVSQLEEYSTDILGCYQRVPTMY